MSCTINVGLVISPWFPLVGGGQKYALEVLQRLTSAGFRFTVLTIAPGLLGRGTGRDCNLDTESFEGVVETIRIPVPRLREVEVGLSFASAARSLARRSDIMHGFSAATRHTAMASLAAGTAKVPFLLTPLYHPNRALSRSRRLLRSATVAASKHRAAGMVFLSVAELDAFVEDFGQPECITSLVPPGLETPQGPRQNRDRPRAVVMGRLVPSKRVDLIVDAFARLSVPEAELVIVGDGPMRPALEARVRDLGIGPRVRFLGSIPDQEKWTALLSSDVVISASEEESFGMAVLEAVSAGTRALISDIAAHTEIVQYSDPSRFSHFAPGQSIDAIAEKLSRMLRLDRLPPLPHNALDWDATADRYGEIYHNLAAGR